jgi:hypothetical protein
MTHDLDCGAGPVIHESSIVAAAGHVFTATVKTALLLPGIVRARYELRDRR